MEVSLVYTLVGSPCLGGKVFRIKKNMLGDRHDHVGISGSWYTWEYSLELFG